MVAAGYGPGVCADPDPRAAARLAMQALGVAIAAYEAVRDGRVPASTVTL